MTYKDTKWATTVTRMVKAQLSEVKDLPVEGDVEVWANRAEGRAVFTSADVEADVKLGDEHKADVGGAVLRWYV